jgi:hypothetical protein
MLRLGIRCKGAGLLTAHVDRPDLAGIDGRGDELKVSPTIPYNLF